MLLGTLIDVTDAGWGHPPTDDRVVDRETVQRMAEGDAEALTTVYDRHIRSVFGLAMRVLENQSEAEDLVQEAFSQAWAQAKRYDATRGSVASWLLMIARSRAIDRLRSRRAKPDSAPFSHDTAVVDLPEPALGAEHRRPDRGGGGAAAGGADRVTADPTCRDRARVFRGADTDGDRRAARANRSAPSRPGSVRAS